jgi:hypothetical protein
MRWLRRAQCKYGQKSARFRRRWRQLRIRFTAKPAVRTGSRGLVETAAASRTVRLSSSRPRARRLSRAHASGPSYSIEARAFRVCRQGHVGPAREPPHATNQPDRNSSWERALRNPNTLPGARPLLLGRAPRHQERMYRAARAAPLDRARFRPRARSREQHLHRGR